MQQSSQDIKINRLSVAKRLIAGGIFLLISVGFLLVHIAAVKKISLYPLACLFNQTTGLPCPSCGMTRSVMVFAQGNILQSFYIQPAGAALCLLAIAVAIFSLLCGIAGTDWGLVSNIKIRYIIVLLLVVIGGGWAVTLARAMAERI